MKTILIAAVVSLLTSILCTPLVVVYFRRRGFGQEIRIDGPQTHLVKRGTPTMGGVAIIGSTVVGYAVAHLIICASAAAAARTRPGLLALFLMVGLGARRLPRRLHQDPPPAQPRPAGPGQVRRPADRRGRVRGAGAAVPQQVRADAGVDAPVLRPRHRRDRPRLGRLRDPRLPDHLGDLERGEPHRRPGRPGRRRGGDGVRRVHADLVPAVPQPVRQPPARRAATTCATRSTSRWSRRRR